MIPHKQKLLINKYCIVKNYRPFTSNFYYLIVELKNHLVEISKRN